MMARSIDPTEPIREKAASFPDVAMGTSCNQSSFKAGKGNKAAKKKSAKKVAKKTPAAAKKNSARKTARSKRSS